MSTALKFETHLFEYHHDGSTWSFEVKATSERDMREQFETRLAPKTARERLRADRPQEEKQ